MGSILRSGRISFKLIREERQVQSIAPGGGEDVGNMDGAGEWEGNGEGEGEGEGEQ